MRVGVSIGNSIAAMHGVMGALMALHQRNTGDGKGQVIDVALYESVFNLMESLLPEYDMFGFIRNSSGASLPGITPSNTYPCRDKKYVVIGANADSISKRMMLAIGRNDLVNDPELAHNDGRVKRTRELDEVIAIWTMQHDLDEILTILDKAEVPAGKIYDIADIVNDPHYQAREMIRQFRLPVGQPLKLPGIVPKLSRTPSEIRWVGPQLGAHTAEVLSSLGYDEVAQAALKAQEVI